MQGKIISNISNLYYIEANEKIYTCNARGKLKDEGIVVGDIVDFDENENIIEKIEERDNYIFEADLYISGYERGRSSAVMLLVPFKDKNKDFFSHKFHYRVFMSDIEDIVKGMVRGRIKGSFTWVKKGSDYGIQLVKVTDRKNGNAESCIG